MTLEVRKTCLVELPPVGRFSDAAGVLDQSGLVGGEGDMN